MSLASSSALTVIGYTSTFLGIIGFYMSVAFYGISLFINVICTGKLPSPPFHPRAKRRMLTFAIRVLRAQCSSCGACTTSRASSKR